MRAFINTRKSRSSGRPSLSNRFPAHAGGRWSLTSHLLTETPTDTERKAAWANLLLDRHGLVTRGTVLAEGYPGGFSALYPVLSHLEETGRIRRGYFVEGLGGSQFALPGAVDRLRHEAQPHLVALAATDPANPYGAEIAWPDSGQGRLARDAGAYVLLYGGQLVGFVDRGRKGLSLIDVDPSLYGAIGQGLSEYRGPPPSHDDHDRRRRPGQRSPDRAGARRVGVRHRGARPDLPGLASGPLPTQEKGSSVKKIGFLSFGHWSATPYSQVRSAQDSLLQSIELAEAAEELGADGAYFRVHHFAQQLGSPFPLLAAIGARTSRIEIGTAVIDMRYENPHYMLEDSGAADIIAGGRLQLGISRGSPEQVIDGFLHFGHSPA